MKEKYILLSDALRIVNETGAHETKKRLKELRCLDLYTCDRLIETKWKQNENGFDVCGNCGIARPILPPVDNRIDYWSGRYCRHCGARNED